MRTSNNNLRRKVFATSALAAALAILPLGGSPALGSTGGGPGAPSNPSPPSRNGQCVTDDGINLNEALGISARIVQQPYCYEVLAGESYVPLGHWYTDASYANAPSPYPLAGPTPMEDFLAKLVAVRYVVDPGTPQERSYRFEARDVVKLHTLDKFFPDEPEYPIAFFAAELPPLPPQMGGHSYQLFIEMSAGHCDGLGKATGNCLPEGESRVGGCPFGVSPAAFQQLK